MRVVYICIMEKEMETTIGIVKGDDHSPKLAFSIHSNLEPRRNEAEEACLLQ